MIRMGMEFELMFPDMEKFVNKKKLKGWVEFANANWEYAQYTDVLDDCVDEKRIKRIPLPKYARKLGYKSGDDIPDPCEVLKAERNVIKEVFNTYIRRHAFVKNFPFTDYKISVKDDKKSIEYSILKPDHSLGPLGLEISTHVMSLNKALDYCDIMFSYIDDHAETTNDCGFHVSISDSSKRKMKKLDVDKMISSINKRYIYAHFPNRKKCDHAKPNSFGHDGAVNLEHLDTDNPYVEFRFLGGKDYHKKFDTIQKIILNYVEAVQSGINI